MTIRIDHREATGLLLTRLATIDATVHVVLAHEPAPPGDPNHAEYFASWCRMGRPVYQPRSRHYGAAEVDVWDLSVVIQAASDPRATGLAPLAIETVLETVAAALDDWTGADGNYRVTLGRAVPAVNADPDPETLFSTGLVSASGTVERLS